MNNLIVVDVGWFRLIIDPEKCFYNMNLRDFKKMLRVAVSVMGSLDEKLDYLTKWNDFLDSRKDLDRVKRKRMMELVTDRRVKVI